MSKDSLEYLDNLDTEYDVVVPDRNPAGRKDRYNKKFESVLQPVFDGRSYSCKMTVDTKYSRKFESALRRHVFLAKRGSDYKISVKTRRLDDQVEFYVVRV